ncbi:MAG: glycoside hydrolase family 57 protein [Myxococcota bacterium]
MPDVCFYFQVHQPFRLNRYGVFDIGKSQDYFDDRANQAILEKVANKCYRPMNALLRELIERHAGGFRISFSVTGTALEQMERWTPDVVESFQALAKTGCVEFLGETFHHSLAGVAHPHEFGRQVALHTQKIEALFGQTPRVFRNTELMFQDELALRLAGMGFRGVLAEGAERVLGWRSPNFVYASDAAPALRLLLKNYQLSDDIAFRFGNRGWSEHPLSVEKFAGWVHAVNGCGTVVNLFMDYETFGEHQWAETGIFGFMRRLPAAILDHADGGFVTPSEALDRHAPAGAVNFRNWVSWADTERDLTAWLGNGMQRTALDQLLALRAPVLESGDAHLIETWRKLSTSDHLYYMCTKYFADGDVHKYFSPYESPYEAHIAFMNVLADLAERVT